jgi:glycosyltransferase involved in cell wall biosynthesis
MPEIIDDGRTGLLVDSPDEAEAAIGRISALDRRAVSQAVAAHFSVGRMAEAYLDLYRRILSGSLAR